MAVKSQAEVLELIQECARLRDLIITFAQGDFTTTRASISAAINAGDDQPEDVEQFEALDACVLAMEDLLAAANAMFFTTHKTLGRYSGSLQLASANVNMQAFHDKLTTDSDSVESRGLTKFSSWSANGSNYGNGRFVVANDDVNGLQIDVSHIETLKLRCISDGGDPGAIVGAESFIIEGSARADEDYNYGGSAGGADYRYRFTGERNDAAEGAITARTGNTIRSVSGSTSTGNLITNGDFETALGSGTTDKISGWVISSGDTNVTVETGADLIAGDQSLEFFGNATMYQLLTIGGLKHYALHCLVRVDAAMTAGTVTIKVKDDSTTHDTISIDTTTLTNDTDTDVAPVTFWLPRNYGENLRVEIELTGYAGSGGVYLDNVALQEMVWIDGRWVAIFEGLLPWRKTDFATGATTSTDGGKLQRSFNDVMGGQGVRPWVRHASTAVDWPDY